MDESSYRNHLVYYAMSEEKEAQSVSSVCVLLSS
jgi:hypothetical protein